MFSFQTNETNGNIKKMSCYCRKKLLLIIVAYLFVIIFSLFTYLLSISSTVDIDVRYTNKYDNEKKSDEQTMTVLKTIGSVSPPLLPEDTQTTDRIVEQLNYVPSVLAERPVKIFVPSGGNGVSDGYDEFVKQDCKVKNCYITSLGESMCRHRDDNK